MPLLCTGDMGVYIASPILKDDSVGCQYMQITHFDSIVGLMKDLSNGLWDRGLCLIQGSCAFVVESTTRLVTASLEIYMSGVVSSRYSKQSPKGKYFLRSPQTSFRLRIYSRLNNRTPCWLKTLPN